MGVELHWTTCTKCGEFVSSTPEAACAAGGVHLFRGTFIGITSPIEAGTNLSGVSTAPGWHRCRFCQCMYFAEATASGIPLTRPVFHPGGGPNPKTCPAIGGGGYHDFTGSPQYLVVTEVQRGDGAAQWMRPGWRQCGKCHALFETTRGADAGHCITDGKPHTGVGANLFVCTERTAKLPLPHKAGAGMSVNLKADVGDPLGYIVIAGGKWIQASELQLSAESNWGESIFFKFDFTMVDGPACALSIQLSGTKSYGFLEIVDFKTVDISPPVNITQTIPCVNQDGRQDPDVEFAPGRNNGEELLLFAVGKLFPKNDNRVRCHLNAAVHGIQDLELETQ